MMIFAVTCFPMSMLILDEDCFIRKIASECDGRDAESWEGALETVPPREWPGIPPCLARRDYKRLVDST